MTSEWDPETVFEMLGSEEVRKILALTNTEPKSAGELADHLSVSQPTVYRRLNVCQEHNLVREETEIDAEGNHRKVYQASLERVTFELIETGFEVNIELRHDPLEDEAFTQ
ncbi:ArsR/SmtB family transcription factor [Halopenitus salinus]|uniref:ArsR/SmtB family transcription factor n=1 Tax=Halopenitus salinus TaxID=1198295 RepID=A0ABD5UVV3_9EURY